MVNKYLVEFLGTLFFLYVILATGNAVAIGAALEDELLLGSLLVAMDLSELKRQALLLL